MDRAGFFAVFFIFAIEFPQKHTAPAGGRIIEELAFLARGHV
jgi:hypothetical protein